MSRIDGGAGIKSFAATAWPVVVLALPVTNALLIRDLRRTVRSEVDELVAWWEQAPGNAPRTLREFSEIVSAIPAEFDVPGDYARELRRAAGLLDADLTKAGLH